MIAFVVNPPECMRPETLGRVWVEVFLRKLSCNLVEFCVNGL